MGRLRQIAASCCCSAYCVGRAAQPSSPITNPLDPSTLQRPAPSTIIIRSLAGAAQPTTSTHRWPQDGGGGGGAGAEAGPGEAGVCAGTLGGGTRRRRGGPAGLLPAGAHRHQLSTRWVRCDASGSCRAVCAAPPPPPLAALLCSARRVLWRPHRGPTQRGPGGSGPSVVAVVAACWAPLCPAPSPGAPLHRHHTRSCNSRPRACTLRRAPGGSGGGPPLSGACMRCRVSCARPAPSARGPCRCGPAGLAETKPCPCLGTSPPPAVRSRLLPPHRCRCGAVVCVRPSSQGRGRQHLRPGRGRRCGGGGAAAPLPARRAAADAGPPRV